MNLYQAIANNDYKYINAYMDALSDLLDKPTINGDIKREAIADQLDIIANLIYGGRGEKIPP